jgi:hypothetical protein
VSGAQGTYVAEDLIKKEKLTESKQEEFDFKIKVIIFKL